MVWPDPGAIKAFKPKNPRVKIILQVGSTALNQVERQPFYLIRRLKEYKGIIDFVLLDDSGGAGRVLNPRFLLPFVLSILQSLLDMRIVIAGGLSKSNLHLITPIVSHCPDLSIDAEGNVRDKVKDCLDMKEVSGFIINSFEFFVHP